MESRAGNGFLVCAVLVGAMVAILPIASYLMLHSLGHGMMPIGDGIASSLRGLAERSAPAPAGSMVVFQGDNVGVVTVIRRSKDERGEGPPYRLMISVPDQLADRIRGTPGLIGTLDAEIRPDRPIHLTLRPGPASGSRSVRGSVELLVRRDVLPLYGPAVPTPPPARAP